MKLKDVFIYSQELIANKGLRTGSRRIHTLPENRKEFIAIYSTDKSSYLLFDCIRNYEFQQGSKELAALGETVTESILDGIDNFTGIHLKTKVCKIQNLTKTIGNDLKVAYGYRCQICGQFIGEAYGSKLIHAHHIDYFTHSINNNANNIMIVCPNHHGIIHDTNPIFDNVKKVFHYPNGYTEGLKLNIHL